MRLPKLSKTLYCVSLEKLKNLHLIPRVPNNFMTNINMDDIGNDYQINMKEIDRLIPTDEDVAKLHSEYSKIN